MHSCRKGEMCLDHGRGRYCDEAADCHLLRSWSEFDAKVSPSQLASLELRFVFDGLRLRDE